VKRRSSTATIRLKLETSDPRLDRWQGEISTVQYKLAQLEMAMSELKEELGKMKAKARPKSKELVALLVDPNVLPEKHDAR